MQACSHVFCRACLSDYYSHAISRGEVPLVRCVEPDCVRDRVSASNGSAANNTFWLHPGELLEIGLPPDVVTRYITLRQKQALEADKRTVYCPRKWCAAPARTEAQSDPDTIAAPASALDAINPPPALAICTTCSFAFCHACQRSWHGAYASCPSYTLQSNELATLAYLAKHTRPCPTCAAPAEKKGEGCNHMVCTRCETHFCFLCSEWLDGRDPYPHWNNVDAEGKGVGGCYQKLWVGLEG